MYTAYQKNIAYLVFYNVKKSEPIITIIGTQHPDNPSL